MNIFENVVFIESNTNNKNKLTPEEKVRVGKNLKKMCQQNKKISDFNDSIDAIRTADKSRYDEIKKNIGIEWRKGEDPFNDKHLKIQIVTDRSDKEIAYYLYFANDPNRNEFHTNMNLNNDIFDYIVASIEYKLSIKVYISNKYLK